MLRFIILAPLIGAAINWLVGRRVRSEAFIGAVASLSIAVSCALAFYNAFGPGGALVGEPKVVLDHVWTWMDVGTFRADIGFAMDRLSGIYACFITFVGLLIHIFATGYMHGDKSFYRFFAYLNLFMFMMLTLVLADNLLLMFVGWEGVGLCSYLLIGYYIDRREAGDAAKKAFVANRVGDWGVVLGIMLVFSITGSISFFDNPDIGVSSALSKIAAMPVEPFHWKALFGVGAGVVGITAAALLLFIGACGKSAQIPLFVWLPDAMAGPTPVSALIHAATMVTAGVYMIVRCSEIYTHAPAAMTVVAVVGAATAIFAATIGLAQNDIKKVLAYSTVSQLGYMVLACGVGAFIAAIFHVMTHAFFKALLFLGSGSVIHGMHHEQDMRRMGGLKKYMPITHWTMFAGWLAICGILPFAGFFSKDEILWKTWSSDVVGIPAGLNKALWFVGAVTAGLTAVYMTRLMAMTFWGTERFREAHAGGQADEAHAHAHDEGAKPHDAHTASAGDRPHHAPGEHVGADAHAAAAHGSHGHDSHGGAGDSFVDEDEYDDEHAHHGPVEPHESPLVMTVPLIVLAVLSTIGGLVGVPYALSSIFSDHVPNYFEHTLEPVVAHAPERHAATDSHGTAVTPAGEAAHGAQPTGEATHGAPPSTATDSHGQQAQPHGAERDAPAAVGEGTRGAPAAEHAAHDPAEVRAERIFSSISLFIAGVGIGVGIWLFGKRPLLKTPRLLENKYYIDELYDVAVINPIKVGSREGLWKIFDVKVIDGLVNGLARATSGVGDIARRMQAGFVRGYAAIILLGALLVIGYFVFNFSRVL
ncbi:MAG TPA: NADH-quinone oxidoreductase subunit L [Pyrinomonadaceae bacterium]|nr:NADH-quinone oxidoreductase subunit L [Pyrinomonadaceae bacterium]